MPLYRTLRLNADCVVVLWKIDETESDLRPLLRLTEPERAELADITHPVQRVEWMGCRLAVRTLAEMHGSYAGLYKDEYGKPHLRESDAQISLSHTHGWAAAVWHRSQPVGIDIEPFRAQFVRVVPRVLSDSEIAHAQGDPARLAIYWCAKEALYKLYGKRQLSMRDHLHIEPFADEAGLLVGHVRWPDDKRQRLIQCFRTGPGLVAVAY